MGTNLLKYLHTNFCIYNFTSVIEQARHIIIHSTSQAHTYTWDMTRSKRDTDLCDVTAISAANAAITGAGGHRCRLF